MLKSDQNLTVDVRNCYEVNSDGKVSASYLTNVPVTQISRMCMLALFRTQRYNLICEVYLNEWSRLMNSGHLYVSTTANRRKWPSRRRRYN